VVWVQHPCQEILNFINEMPLTLFIKDAHEESAFERVFFTPLDWQLLRDCPVPVHLLTSPLWGTNQDHRHSAGYYCGKFRRHALHGLTDHYTGAADTRVDG
jgi:hypothetical protein